MSGSIASWSAMYAACCRSVAAFAASSVSRADRSSVARAFLIFAATIGRAIAMHRSASACAAYCACRSSTLPESGPTTRHWNRPAKSRNVMSRPSFAQRLISGGESDAPSKKTSDPSASSGTWSSFAPFASTRTVSPSSRANAPWCVTNSVFINCRLIATPRSYYGFWIEPHRATTAPASGCPAWRLGRPRRSGRLCGQNLSPAQAGDGPKATGYPLGARGSAQLLLDPIQLAQVIGLAAGDEGRGRADLHQRAVRAPPVVHRRRHRAGAPHLPNLRDHGLHLRPQLLRERDLPPSPRRVVIDSAGRNRAAEHLLQADGLRAELQVIVPLLPLRAVLRLHREDAAVGVELDGVGAAVQAQPFAPERQRPLDPRGPAHLPGRRIDALVNAAAAQREHVLIVDLLDVDESALPRAIRPVLDRGDHHSLVVLPHGDALL